VGILLDAQFVGKASDSTTSDTTRKGKRRAKKKANLVELSTLF
jgi:hypothetical protein